MSANTDHCLGIDVQKTDAYVAVIDEEEILVEGVCVANADIDETAQQYEES